MKINVISESGVSPGQGPHTAFIEHCEFLHSNQIPYTVNRFTKADIYHAHTMGPLYWLFSAFRKHIVLTGHVTPDSLKGCMKPVVFWQHFMPLYCRWVYNHADLVLAVSPTVKKDLEALGVHKPIVFLPNPVNRKRFSPSPALRQHYRQKMGCSDKDFVVISCGQMQTRKGTQTFIRLARELPQFKFIWVGDFAFGKITCGLAEIKTMLQQQPENLTITGLIPYAEMNGYYNLADLYCFPSFQENFTFSVVEAAACGLPLILRDITEYEDIFSAAYLPCTEEQFKDAIVKLATDKQALARYRQKAQELAARYSFEQVNDHLLAIYQNMIAS